MMGSKRVPCVVRVDGDPVPLIPPPVEGTLECPGTPKFAFSVSDLQKN